MEITVNYPPEEIVKPNFSNPNFELIILWMLNYNEYCTWGNFQRKISKSTLQVYLKKLMKNGYINKTRYNEYRITPDGKKRFNKLSEFKKEKRKLNYPPRIILKHRNYKDWILWMVFNNTYCKWADFLEDPLSINQSSLSKKMNSLINKGFVKKEDKKYEITQSGKIRYSKMLRNYNLDRQTILEEESKRIKDITRETIDFFERFHVKDKNIKFRYLNKVLKLPYEKIKPILKEKDDFNKVLLFLSINHPEEYPNYISPEDFSQKYAINLVKLKFILLQIIEEDIFPIKFFKLETEFNSNYYFQVNEKLERMLNAAVEDHITQFTYLYNLYEETSNEITGLSLDLILNEILEDICGSLFNNELRDNLRAFLPHYIDYLAYKIEKKKKLRDIYDKLEVLIWQNMLEKFQTNMKVSSDEKFEKKIKQINQDIKLEPENLKLYQSKLTILMRYDKFKDTISVIDEMLERFPKEEKDLKIKKAHILKSLRKVEKGLKIINELIDKHPDDNDLLSYKAYWLQYLNKKEKAIGIMQNLVDQVPENSSYRDTYGEILMNFKYYKNAISAFLKAIELEPKGWFIYQTFIKLGICYKELEQYNLAVKYLKKGKKLSSELQIDPRSKEKWLSIANLFLNEIDYERQSA